MQKDVHAQTYLLDLHSCTAERSQQLHVLFAAIYSISFQQVLIQKYQSLVYQFIRSAVKESAVISHIWGIIVHPWEVFCVQSGLSRSADPTQRVHPPNHSFKDMQMYTRLRQSRVSDWMDCKQQAISCQEPFVNPGHEVHASMGV